MTTLRTTTRPQIAAKPQKRGGVFPILQLGLGIRAQLMEITPALAEEWLAKNPRVQRNMSQTEVEMLARHLDRGEWMLNGATIVFSSDDRLCDGQHRLAACIRSGKPIMAIVVYGVDPKAFDTMDAGRSRSGRDALQAAGITHQTAVSAACQILYRIEQKLPIHPRLEGHRVRLSPMEILAFCKSHPGLDKKAPRAMQAGRIIHHNGIALACMWLFDRINLHDSNEFFDRLTIGDKLEKGHPILTLRDLVMAKYDYKANVIWMMFGAWNAFRRKESAKVFAINTGKPLPDLV